MSETNIVTPFLFALKTSGTTKIGVAAVLKNFIPNSNRENYRSAVSAGSGII